MNLPTYITYPGYICIYTVVSSQAGVCMLGDIYSCAVLILVYICVTGCIYSTYTIVHMFLDFLFTYSQDSREAIL